MEQKLDTVLKEKKKKKEMMDRETMKSGSEEKKVCGEETEEIVSL